MLSGGELPAAMIVDAVTRLIPGALGNEDSAVNESFSEHKSARLSRRAAIRATDRLPPTRHARQRFLDFPHYTRPASFRGWDVPEVLLSGNHEEIRAWRRQKAIEKTLRNRPDLLSGPVAAASNRRC